MVKTEFEKGKEMLMSLQSHLKEALTLLTLSGNERQRLRKMLIEVQDLYTGFIARQYKG